jgi:hypothetical protein
MEKNTIRFMLLTAAVMLALPFALAKSKYPKTATCPVDSGTAHATGKTKTTMDPQCTAVEYKHKGTDYTNPRHPQRFQHVFWLTMCNEASSD